MRNSVLCWSWKFHGKILKKCKRLSILSIKGRFTQNKIIWPILLIFRGFLDINQTFQYKLSYHKELLVWWFWFLSKVFIFDPVMAKKWRTCPYFGIGFLAIIQPFLGQFWWLLSIDWCWDIQGMLFIIHFWATFGCKIAVATTHAPNSNSTWL